MENTDIQEIQEILSNELINIEMPKFDDLSTAQLRRVIKFYRIHMLYDIQSYTKKSRDELLEICSKMFNISNEGIELKRKEPLKFAVPVAPKRAKKTAPIVNNTINDDNFDEVMHSEKYKKKLLQKVEKFAKTYNAQLLKTGKQYYNQLQHLLDHMRDGTHITTDEELDKRLNFWKSKMEEAT